jgi:predicted short-subunit dehydrogenase-like oxidoreductase (DUF2520 family)
MRTVIIGSGNTATVLGRKFLQAGHEVLQVVGRNRETVEQLAILLQAGSETAISNIRNDADIYILTIPDDAIAAIAAQLHLDKKLVVHTAGSVSKDVLKTCSRNYGILWPVQSLRKEMTALAEIPFVIDANTADNMAVIEEFALSMKGVVKIAGDEERLKLHLAAVVASNFTNHLYALTDEYCRKEKLPFDTLQPLISAIADRIRHYPPATVQTGPAVRHDTHTIDKHLELLKDYLALKEFYSLFSASIEKMYK